MNGGLLKFDWADGNRDKEITASEWPQLLRKVEDIRSRYDTHGMLAIQINSAGFVAAVPPASTSAAMDSALTS